MKISLTNFKCWADSSFDLGKNGITLIKGNSGVGKSSILDAIYFALYGKGMKVLKVGTKSCKVVLETHNMSITRTKGPNRLVVKKNDDVYEDKAGQSIIDDMFTHNYDGTGYMKQNDQNSFILLSPTDKLSFIEQYAFLGVDIQTYKQHIKDIQKERDGKMTGISANLQMTADVLSEKEEPEEVKEPRILDKKIVAEKIEKNNALTKKTKKMVDRLQKKLEKRGNLQTFVQTTLSRIEELKQTIQPTTDDNIDQTKKILEEDKNTLHTYLQHKQKLIDYKQLQKDKEKMEALYEKEKMECVNRRDELKDIVWKQHTKEECKEFMRASDEYNMAKKVCDRAMRQLNTLQYKDVGELENAVSQLQTLIGDVEISNKTYACPSCKAHVYVSGGTLHACNEKRIVDKKEFESYKRRLTLAQKARDEAIRTNTTIEKLQKEVEQFGGEAPTDVSEYYDTNMSLEKELQRLCKKIDADDFLRGLRKDIDERDMGEVADVDDVDEESLRQKIHQFELRIKDSERIYKETKKTKQKIKYLRQSIQSSHDEFIRAYGTDEDPSNAIEEQKEMLEKLSKKLKSYQELQIEIQRYNQYKLDHEDYTTWCKKYDELQQDEIEMSNKLCSINTLRDLVADAESLAITNVINRMEDMVQDYLDVFFTEEPMCIKLYTFKEDKKKKSKAQINVVMEYKGMECTVGMLSGGELQRVMLAFNLAMVEIYNLPFVLLDETMSNLDEETTQTIVDGIKEKCGDKLVVIIAHQVVSGVFDKTIDIQ